MMTSKEIIQRIIGALEDDLQHYTMVDKDNVKAKLIKFELEEYNTILKDLVRKEKLEEVIDILKNKFNITIEECNWIEDEEEVKVYAILRLFSQDINTNDYNECAESSLNKKETIKLKEVLGNENN